MIYNNGTPYQALFSRKFCHGVSQCVVGPTRHWPGQPSSGLDHYYTNRTDKISAVQKQQFGGSDHMLIFAVRYTKTFCQPARYSRKRSYKSFNKDEFVSAVQNISWWSLYMGSDVDEAVQILSCNLNNILDRMAPMRTIQIRSNYVPWLSQETKYLMKRNPGREKKLDKCFDDSSQLWKNVKCILNWNTSSSQTQIFNKGKIISKPEKVAEAQNEYFLEKIRDIKADLESTSSDPLEFVASLMKGRKCSFSFKPVFPDEVGAIIGSLKISKSFGLDSINTFIVKLVQKNIVPAITHIINLSLKSKTFPKMWKM